jgi:hypothetical protein
MLSAMTRRSPSRMPRVLDTAEGVIDVPVIAAQLPRWATVSVGEGAAG